LNRVSSARSQIDARIAIARDQIARRRRGAANSIVVSKVGGKENAAVEVVGGVRPRHCSGRIGPDEISLNHVAVGRNEDSILLKAVNYEAAHRAVVGIDTKAWEVAVGRSHCAAELDL